MPTFRISSVGVVPMNPTKNIPVQGHDRVSWLYTPAHVSTNGGHISCTAAEGDEVNGTYLYGQDDLVALTPLNQRVPVVVSGGYSGCLFRVIQISDYSFTCMHIYRPRGNAGIEEAAERYRRAVGGLEIVTLGSSGLVNPGTVDGVWFVCKIRSSDKVDVIRLEVSRRGAVVGSSAGVYPSYHNFTAATNHLGARVVEIRPTRRS